MHPLIQTLLALLPREAGQAAIAFAVVGAVAGALLWVAGARFSRYLITLAAVAIGTGVGVGLPRWFGWNIDHMAPAVGGAIVLGASAYMMHRMWVGLWLGFVVAVWAAIGTWMVFAANQAWDWPSPQGATVPGYIKQVWDALPADVTHALPVLCAAAFVIGAIPAMVWPRAGMAVLYSAFGATLVAVTGTMLVSAREPQWLAKVPPQASRQLVAMGLVELLGAGLQWQLYFRRPAAPNAPKASA
jgi:hypothetical protein